jgi:hypothetical protein
LSSIHECVLHGSARALHAAADDPHARREWGHRVQPIRDTSGAFSRIDRKYMYDSTLDTECEIVGNQCWPIDIYVRPVRYSDAGCTQVLDVQDYYPNLGCTFSATSRNLRICRERTWRIS